MVEDLDLLCNSLNAAASLIAPTHIEIAELLLRAQAVISEAKKTEWKDATGSIPTVEERKEGERTKFYYVESIDDYWIGEDLGGDCTLYYAKWDNKLGFVFSASRYLPWGEHVVSPTSLWKEYTYPSEPKEIPFTDWITGFVKKYFKGE